MKVRGRGWMLMFFLAVLVSGCDTSGRADVVSAGSPETQDDGTAGEMGLPPGPPPPPAEALDACSSLAAGDACSFEVKGTCRSGPDDASLACAPMPPRHPAPPLEAIEACAGLAAEDSCTVSLRARTLDGTCRQGPDEADLVCAPAFTPPAPPAPPEPPAPPQAALDACANLGEGESCGFALEGTCQGPDQAPLGCAPVRPPQANP